MYHFTEKLVSRWNSFLFRQDKDWDWQGHRQTKNDNDKDKDKDKDKTIKWAILPNNNTS